MFEYILKIYQKCILFIYYMEYIIRHNMVIFHDINFNENFLYQINLYRINLVNYFFKIITIPMKSYKKSYYPVLQQIYQF